MYRFINNNRGSSIIEIVIIIAILAMLPLLLFSTLKSDSTDADIQSVQETASANQTGSTQSLDSDVIIIFVGFLVLIGVLVLIGGSIFLFIRWQKKKEQGPQNANEMLRFILRKKPKKLFVLQKGANDVHSYQYTVSMYEWLLDATASQLDIKMEKKEKQVLHITYDKTTENFTRKNVKAHVFSDEKTLKQLDKLIDAIIATEWVQHSTYNLLADSDDLDRKIPQQVEETIHTVITNPMLELEAQIEKIIEDAETKEKFQLVIENMNLLQHYQEELDIETKHIIEYSLTNDLNRLLSLYETLNEDQKETMAEEIQARLDLMNEKVEQIQTKMQEKKASEIKKALHLFDERYKA